MGLQIPTRAPVTSRQIKFCSARLTRWLIPVATTMKSTERLLLPAPPANLASGCRSPELRACPRTSEAAEVGCVQVQRCNPAVDRAVSTTRPHQAKGSCDFRHARGFSNGRAELVFCPLARSAHRSTVLFSTDIATIPHRHCVPSPGAEPGTSRVSTGRSFQLS